MLSRKGKGSDNVTFYEHRWMSSLAVPNYEQAVAKG